MTKRPKKQKTKNHKTKSSDFYVIFGQIHLFSFLGIGTKQSLIQLNLIFEINLTLLSMEY